MSTVGLAYAEAKSGWTRKTRDTQNVCACNMLQFLCAGKLNNKHNYASVLTIHVS